MKEEERFWHHSFLSIVAQEDVQFLLERDRAYGASWKGAGGRSAWHNLRRKMDRLVQIMAPPKTPEGFNLENVGHLVADYFTDSPAASPSCHRLNAAAFVLYLRDCYVAENIFAAIRNRPGGEDGSALAEVRDLRRYLLLVEAEMMARGVVARPDAPKDAAILDQGFTVHVEPLVPRYTGDSDVCVGPSGGTTEWSARGGGGALPGFDGSVEGEPRPVSLSSAAAPVTSALIRAGHVHERQPVPRLRGDATRRTRVEDGCSAADRVPGVPYLELRDVRDERTAYYVADRAAMTEDEVEHLPRLFMERNELEYQEERPWYRPMYEWCEAETKWRLKPQFRDSWGRQP